MFHNSLYENHEKSWNTRVIWDDLSHLVPCPNGSSEVSIIWGPQTFHEIKKISTWMVSWLTNIFCINFGQTFRARNSSVSGRLSYPKRVAPQCLRWCTARQVAEFVRSIQSGSQLHRRKQLRRHKKRKRAKNSDEFNGHFGWFCVGWETISVSQCPYSNYECNMYTYRLEQPWTRKLYYRNQSISFSWTFLSFATEHTSNLALAEVSPNRLGQG